ncbi:putative sporulation protein YyaC [Clostridium collagenovorans DSM 3089]|uniref:Putative sporulation protein YyaC n=1 Tax=Clostridium collagenovorans DSM 3089 TaxID=1121306 RepID=A0A1M5YHQ2_9CLOT|nr:spore protease YyaC [Clostridium collagenovorans]SHI11033.1 putative sporulation protein YyaC [Clostridium collagenovorans DSM 3089]
MKKLIFDSIDSKNIKKLRDSICEHLCPAIKSKRDIVILCIGTDRATGDCLGPLVGEKLKFLSRKRIHIFGNLENPIHAQNIENVITTIKSTFNDPYIIAIDACLGSLHNVGYIVLDTTPINPGAALNKNLPSVGDLSIIGIVNITGPSDFSVLQNTRLYTVMMLAEAISTSLYHAILKSMGGKKHSEALEDEVC